MQIIYTCLISILAFMNMDSQQSNSKLTINLNGLRNDKGNVMIGVYDKADGFPDDYQKIYLQKIYPASDVISKPIIIEVPRNKKYAVAIIHDENKNNKLDTNFLGMPTEGYGFSNNKTGVFGAPSFKDCCFDIGDVSQKSIHIKLKY
ncbi:MAG: DUF2141 domain-containing protein [Flavobacteriales bacterium]